ncbi:phage/plasmid primase, P4 family [Niveispirillum lacus]|nr:phage/plasmid primase, P4 family [Niveispirillum lacus]
MTEEIMKVAGYATAKALDGVGLLIRDIKGAEKVPGMPEPGSQRFQMVAGALLVPVRNHAGDIVGMRQRVETEDGGKKYLWLPGSVPAVHFPAVTAARQSGRLIVTEGEIKADLVTSIGDYALSIPGVSSWRLAIDEVVDCQLVDADGGSFYNELVIALDADFKRKFGVAQAVAAMAAEALARNIPASVLDWPEALGKGLDDFLTREGAGRGPDLYAGATFRQVTEELVEELQALADRLLQEEQDRRDAAAAAAGGVDESPAIGGEDDYEEYDRLAGDALRGLIDETQEVGSEGHIRKMEMQEQQEFAVDAAKVAVRRIVDRPRKELLLDDDLRRAFLAHVETLGEAECTRLRIYKPIIELFRKVDTALSADGFAAPARRALEGYLSHARTEVGFALRMAARFRHEILHAGGLGWYVWDGMSWVHDPDEVRVMAKAQQLTFEIEAELDFAEACALAGVYGPTKASKAAAEYRKVAGNLHGPSDGEMRDFADKERAEHAKYCDHTQSAAFIRSAVSFLRPHLEVDDKALDAHPHLLNTRSGIVDLRTGALTPHDPAMLLTQITSCGWSPRPASCPRWTRFVEEVLAEEDGSVDPEYVRYFKALIGYAAWGIATEQKLVSVWGEGANGKTVLFEAVRDILGSYARTIEPALLIKADADSGGKPRADILALRAARFVLASEPERGEAMAEGLVKRLTGGDQMSARYGYSNEVVEFRFNGKIFLLCNSLLRISGTDRGIWRRQEVLRFLRLWRVAGEENDQRMKDLPLADKNLAMDLRGEMDGILAWIVEGAVDWHKHGLIRPRRVTDAVVEYRGEQDRVGQFIAERVERDESSDKPWVAQSRLYDAYKKWCLDSGTQPMAKDRLKGALKDHGFHESRNAGGMIWKGLYLLPEPASSDRNDQAAGRTGSYYNGGHVQQQAPAQQQRRMRF